MSAMTWVLTFILVNYLSVALTRSGKKDLPNRKRVIGFPSFWVSWRKVRLVRPQGSGCATTAEPATARLCLDLIWLLAGESLAPQGFCVWLTETDWLTWSVEGRTYSTRCCGSSTYLSLATDHHFGATRSRITCDLFFAAPTDLVPALFARFSVFTRFWKKGFFSLWFSWLLV